MGSLGRKVIGNRAEKYMHLFIFLSKGCGGGNSRSKVGRKLRIAVRKLRVSRVG